MVEQVKMEGEGKLQVPSEEMGGLPKDALVLFYKLVRIVNIIRVW